MEMNKMNALVFFCVVFGSMTSQTAMATTGTTSCTAPSVRKGESVIITCDFGKNISKLLPVTFNLEQYPSNDNNKEVSVVDCNWIDTDQPICQPSTGYTFNGWTLRFVIENASERQTGRYACKTMSSVYKPDPNTCTFQLAVITTTTPANTTNTSATTTTTQGSSNIALIAGVVVPVIAIVVAVIVGVLLFRRKRARNGANDSVVAQPLMPRPAKQGNGTGADERNQDNPPQPAVPGEQNSLPAEQGTGTGADERNQDNPPQPAVPGKQERSDNTVHAEQGTGTGADERNQDNPPQPAVPGEQDSIPGNCLPAEEVTETSDEKNDQDNTPQSADPGAQERQDKDEDVPSVKKPSDDEDEDTSEKLPLAPLRRQLKDTGVRKPWENEDDIPPP